MFSVTIPTLWKADEIYDSLVQLEECDLVKEVFIINNSINERKLSEQDLLLSEKFSLYTPYTNLNITKSWNLGVQLSNFNVCLLNDDIVLNNSVFSNALEHIEEAGVIGLAEGSIGDYITNSAVVAHSNEMNYNFGCCMFFKKQHFTPIPLNIENAYNDNFIFETLKAVSGKENKKIYCNVKGRISVTMNVVPHDTEAGRLNFINEMEKFYNERKSNLVREVPS